MTEPNLVPYLPKLTTNQKAVLLRLVRETPGYEHHFEGTLPFISLKAASGVLRLVARGGYSSDKWKAFSRIAREILAKLDDTDTPQSIKFYIYLDDKKVYRQFGRNPERGKPLNFLPKEKVTVGVKYSLPYKDYLPDKDVLVAPSVVLKKVTVPTGGMWEVTAPARHWSRIEAWLQQHCQ